MTSYSKIKYCSRMKDMEMLKENVCDFVHGSIHDITLYINICYICICYKSKASKKIKLTSSVWATFNSSQHVKYEAMLVNSVIMIRKVFSFYVQSQNWKLLASYGCFAAHHQYYQKMSRGRLHDLIQDKTSFHEVFGFAKYVHWVIMSFWRYRVSGLHVSYTQRISNMKNRMCLWLHGHAFCITGLLWGNSNSHWWISLIKDQ